MSYLILWYRPEDEYDGYHLINGFNVNEAIWCFYSQHPHEGISEDLFYKMINNMDIESAIETHNALCPNFRIVEIHKISEQVYQGV